MQNIHLGSTIKIPKVKSFTLPSDSAELLEGLGTKIQALKNFSNVGEPLKTQGVATVLKNDLLNSSKQKAEDSGSLLFGKDSGKTRRNLRYELKIPNAKELRIEREMGLNFTRDQRMQIIDKYFPKYYGQEITKGEFHKQIGILQRKAVADPIQRRQQIREIKYLKKIGGIK